MHSKSLDIKNCNGSMHLGENGKVKSEDENKNEIKHLPFNTGNL
jgi:hypothetical protein